MGTLKGFPNPPAMGSGEQSSPAPDAPSVSSSPRAETLKKLIASRPSDPFPRYGLAHEYKNAGQLAEAREEFTVLLRDHPDYTAGYLHAGNVLLALGERDEARVTYERGIEACRRRGDGHAMSELEGALSSLDSGAP